MQPQSPNKQKSKKNSIQSLNLDLLFDTESKQQVKKIVNDTIRPLSFKSKQQLEVKIKNKTTQRYFDKESQEITKIGRDKLIRDIQLLNSVFKQTQLSSPIADSFNFLFIDLLVNVQKSKLISQDDLLALWEVLPFRNLGVFLQKLNLSEQFRNQNKQKFSKTLLNLINDGKLQPACVYYKLYGRLPEFEEEILIPKLINSDQVYSPVIIDLFKSNKQLKQKVIQNIDQGKAVIILQHLQQDPRVYPTVNKYILRKHYHSMCHQYTQWYIFQDKMSFNPVFLQWYCDENQLSQDIKQSIRFRNKLGGNDEKVPNPLFVNDDFKCSQAIFSKFKQGPQKQVEQQAKYVSLKQYGVSEQHVHFIDNSSSQSFDKMVKILQNCQYIGFDAQNRCTSTKYQQLGVALIQLSTGKQIYLIDFLCLDSDKKFVEFFTKLLSNPNTIIIGHSIQSDMKFIQRTMKIQGLDGFVDISKLFKQKFPNQTQNSLAFMTNFMLGKQLSKYEQRSNWNRRPLKKSQSHYAALDAQICLQLYYLLRQKEVQLTQAIIKNKKKTIINIIRGQNIVYQQGQQELLKRQTPKFLVDSMLKKLCTLLRNLGIDAQYVTVSNFQLMQETAKNQERVILTRDRKLLSKKSPQMPIYCIAEKGDSDLMLQQIKKQFQLDLSLFTPLSRCVKCNCPQLQIIQPQQALKYLNFEYQDTKIQEFWRCVKCKQIYWEGNQFKNAKKKFSQMNS